MYTESKANFCPDRPPVDSKSSVITNQTVRQICQAAISLVSCYWMLPHSFSRPAIGQAITYSPSSALNKPSEPYGSTPRMSSTSSAGPSD
jgi:hypothetical protein